MLRATKKILSILSDREKNWMVFIGIMMLIGGVTESISVTLILPLVEAVMDNGTWNQKWYAEVICSLFNINTQKDYVIVLLIVLICAFILKNLFLLFEYYIQYRFISKARYGMQKSLLHSFLHKPYSYYLKASSGTIIRIVSADTNQAFALFTNVLTFFTELIVTIVLGVTIFFLSPVMAGGLIIILLIEMIVIMMIIKPVIKKSGNVMRFESAKANKWLLQSINGIKSVKVSSKEDFFESKFSEHAKIQIDMDRRNQTLQNVPRLIIEAFTIAALLLWVLIMVLFGMELTTLIPALSTLVVAAVRILPSINRISNAMSQVTFAEGGLDNIIEIINDGTDEDRVLEGIYDEKITFSESVDFSDIKFMYQGADKPVFDGASFSIKLGESVGIVGTSGSGKTTAIDIMLGLLKPNSGAVYVDGINIEKNLNAWLEKVAYIPQNIFLMDDTIRANIVFGKHTSEIDDEMVWKALQDAQLDKFVRELPEGLETVVGEQGVRLSGGQRQRIGIARALFNDPEILFFDEATSALDNETEAAIMESIEGLKGKKTLIIIAHRLSTINNCDKVYRVEDGKITKER